MCTNKIIKPTKFVPLANWYSVAQKLEGEDGEQIRQMIQLAEQVNGREGNPNPDRILTPLIPYFLLYPIMQWQPQQQQPLLQPQQVS